MIGQLINYYVLNIHHCVYDAEKYLIIINFLFLLLSATDEHCVTHLLTFSNLGYLSQYLLLNYYGQVCFINQGYFQINLCLSLLSLFDYSVLLISLSYHAFANFFKRGMLHYLNFFLLYILLCMLIYSISLYLSISAIISPLSPYLGSISIILFFLLEISQLQISQYFYDYLINDFYFSLIQINDYVCLFFLICLLFIAKFQPVSRLIQHWLLILILSFIFYSLTISYYYCISTNSVTVMTFNFAQWFLNQTQF